MKQSLVTRKNRKLRELRRLYPGGPGQTLLPTRHRAARPALSVAPRLLGVTEATASEHGTIGAVYLTRDQIATRVSELGEEIARDYAGLDPILVAPLKSSVVFLADLTRMLPIPHTLDLVELAAYTGSDDGGVRLLKDVDAPLEARHVLIVEDVIDTGLTLHFLVQTLALRNPASLAAVSLVDRTDVSWTTSPSGTSASRFRTSFSPGTVGLDERWRAYPDLHSVIPAEVSPSGCPRDGRSIIDAQPRAGTPMGDALTVVQAGQPACAGRVAIRSPGRGCSRRAEAVDDH